LSLFSLYGALVAAGADRANCSGFSQRWLLHKENRLAQCPRLPDL